MIVRTRVSAMLAEAPDTVNHPKHYQKAAVTVTIEPIELCRRLPFCLGCAVKYMLRAPYKGHELEDLQKALWYLKDYDKSTWYTDERIPSDVIRLGYYFSKQCFKLFDPDFDHCRPDLVNCMGRLMARIKELKKASDDPEVQV